MQAPFAGRAAPSSSELIPQFSSYKPPTPEIPDHELLCLIGRGAYGEVWMARNAIGTLRAVKIIRRQSFQQADHFEREFRGLLKFEPISRSHDGLVDILQIGRRDDAGYFFYVMELADSVSSNQYSVSSTQHSNVAESSARPTQVTAPLITDYSPRTLRSELQRRTRLPPAECVTLGLKLADALEHLHTNGLVHRDIKPSNIIFVKGEPKLADIGLVSAIDEAQSLVGTVGYIPPEGPGTPQADLYSLGKVLYEIAFGKDRQEFPRLPSDLQAHPDYAALLELNEVILKGCETDPRQRYANATALRQDLTLLLRGQSVKQAHKSARRWKVVRQLVLVTLVLASLVGVVKFLNSTKRSYTPHPEAMRQYELGRWFCNQLTSEAHRKALEHLSRAVELDPKFVPPYRELTAICVWGQAGLFASDEARLRKTKEIADTLLVLDPKLAEGHAALSWSYFMELDWRRAEDEILRAIELDPNYPLARDVYVFYLSMQGRTDEAQRHAQRSQELEPTARTTALVASWPFIAARQFDKAIAQLQRVVELDKNFSEAHNFLGRCYEAQSNYLAAIEEYQKTDLLDGRDLDRVTACYAALRQAYDTAGQEGYLRQWIELAREHAALPEAERFFSEVNNAGYFARLGENQKALDALEAIMNTGVRHQLKFEPMFDPLHDEPRFKALLKQVGLEK